MTSGKRSRGDEPTAAQTAAEQADAPNARLAKAPTVFGTYRISSVLSWGQAGVVYRARPLDTNLAETDLALKVLLPQAAGDPEQAALFRREAYILSILRHPNLVRIDEAGIDNGQLFIAMEYVDGCDLYALLKHNHGDDARIPPVLVAYLAMEVLKGLAAAHDLQDPDGLSLDLVHRDLKPSNILLSFSGRVLLSDFGVAAITSTRKDPAAHVGSIGTAGYLAPEQIADQDVDRRTDIFSLGAVMFEALAGRPLFRGASVAETLRLNAMAEVPRLLDVRGDLPTGLAAIVDRALQRNPQRRYQDAREMLQDLEDLHMHGAGIQLALASLVRDRFLSRYKETIFGEPLRAKPGEGEGRVVGWMGGPADAGRAAIVASLLSSHYWVEVYDSTTAMGQALREEPVPCAVLVDLGAVDLCAENLLDVFAGSTALVPLIGIARGGLEPQHVALAFETGVVDVLLEPVRVTRLLAAIEAAACGVGNPTLRAPGADEPGATGALPEQADAGLLAPLLFISKASELVSRCTGALQDWGFRFEAVVDAEEALDRLHVKSYRAVVYDACGGIADCRRLVSRLRRISGAGVLPVLALVEPDLAGVSTGLRGVLLRRRTDAPVLYGIALRELLSKVRRERAFVRVQRHLPVEVRYAGRRLQGHVIDVGRLGLGVLTDVAPRAGTEVEVEVLVDGDSTPIVARGIVARVDHPPGVAERARLGVQIGRFRGDDEKRWIDHITQLLGRRRRVGGFRIS